jgi:hypothetical protein
MKSRRDLLFIFVILVISDICYGWQEASECTTGQLTNSKVTKPPLTLDCGKNLLFIAWSHYGHRNFDLKNKIKSHPIYNFNSNQTNRNENCYFSPSDCTVSVDYIANECNGLSSCQINSDTQYLHSCKSYSDYIFIIYDCIEAKSTVNICDSTVDINTEFDSNPQSSSVYIQSPDYPYEYATNLNCNCSMQTVSGSPLQLQLLEFDLESSIAVPLEDDNDYLSSSSSLIVDSDEKIESNRKGESKCSKDFFSFSQNSLSDLSRNETRQFTQKCGQLNSFSNLFDSKLYDNSNVELREQTSEITNFQFFSDDSLTRRGFWMRIKASFLNIKCPKDFLLIDNVCVRIYDESVTWYEAQNFCDKLGYSLAMIDNFELDNQVNQALFDKKNESINYRQHRRQSNSFYNNEKEQEKRFWIGMRHLNTTNWFNHENKIIKFRDDEQNWWPWLIVDSTTYNKGSCVAKKYNSFNLEDCYQRMPFACQYKPKMGSEKVFETGQATPKIHLKCSKNAEESFKVPTKTTTLKTVTTTTTPLNLINFNKISTLTNKLEDKPLPTKINLPQFDHSMSIKYKLESKNKQNQDHILSLISNDEKSINLITESPSSSSSSSSNNHC